MNVEFLHGWGWDILALSFGSILQQNIRLDSKRLMNKSWKNTFNSIDNTLGLSFLHVSNLKQIIGAIDIKEIKTIRLLYYFASQSISK
jgi:hypothetical protein